MKVYKKNYAHRNLLVFILLSEIYLIIVYAFSQGVSFFSKLSLVTFITHDWPIVLLASIVLYSVFKFKWHAKYLLICYFFIIVVVSFILLSNSFNKLVLALNFAYTLFAFYFYTTWEIERNLACYNPLFVDYDLEKQSRFPIHGLVYNADRTSVEKIFLTNLDEHSCFMMFENPQVEMRPFVLEVIFDNMMFSSNIMTISSYDQGIGVSFVNDDKITWSLSELCKICRQRGLFLVV